MEFKKTTQRLFSSAGRYANLHAWSKTIKKEDYFIRRKRSFELSKADKKITVGPSSFTLQNLIVMRGS